MAESSLTVHANSGFIPFSLYGELIKGKQTFLLLYTSVFAYLVSSYPNPVASDAILLSVAMFFSISGSTLLNMYIDRDIDAIMPRTKHRALPSGRISASTVRNHGFIFSFGGVLGAAYFLNPLTGMVIALGLFFDVIVYSLWLKRRTKWSIIFGGISGGLPAMAGRTAVTNQVDLVAVLLLLFILLWIPLHILTLATLPKNLEGYRDAGVPMWPVAAGVKETRYVVTIAAFLDGLLLTAVGYALGLHPLTHIPLILFGLFLIKLSIDNFRNPDEETTFKLFKFASMFMAMTYLWMYVGTVITGLLG